MPKTPQTILLLITVASGSCLAVAGGQENRPPVVASATLLSPLHTREADEAESVQSVLLLYLARNVSKAEAKKLEARLLVYPDMIDVRLTKLLFGNSLTERGCRKRGYSKGLLEQTCRRTRSLSLDPDGKVESYYSERRSVPKSNVHRSSTTQRLHCCLIISQQFLCR